MDSPSDRSAAPRPPSKDNAVQHIYLEDCFEVEDDDVLMELAIQEKGCLTLVIVPDGVAWNKDFSQTVDSVASIDNHEVDSSSRQNNHLDNCSPKFNSELKSILQQKKALDYASRKSLVHIIMDYMNFDLGDFTRGTAEKISREIINAYPQSFNIKLGGETLDSGVECLRQQIYDGLNYQKKRMSAKRSITLDENETVKKLKTQDEYGCVAYLPNLPPTETWETQETKNSLLNAMFESQTMVNEEILELMRQTYYLQRSDLHQNDNLSVIFDKWPYFRNFKTLINHANQLLGKNLEDIWNENLKNLSKPINTFFRDAEIVKDSLKNKKTSPEDNRYVREMLKKSKEYCKSHQNQDPYQEIIFDFITRHMKEDLNFFYIFVKGDLSDGDILEHVPVSTPVLVIRGEDLHSRENRFNVVIEQKFSIPTESFTNGILINFLAYYVFGIVYPKEIERTLETIQRLLLRICPPKGTKRGGNRKATTINPKVKRFIDELQHYIE